jgi:hypothetical protein
MTYYFDYRNGPNLIPDEEGMELPHLAAVEVEAARALADLARDSIRGNSETAAMSIEVRDDTGPVLKAKLSFEIERRVQQ